MLEILNSIPTKQLLYLYRCFAHSRLDWEGEERKKELVKYDLRSIKLLFIYNKMSDKHVLIIKDLKDLLGTKEHVRNKKEAALYRKQSAKNKRRN